MEMRVGLFESNFLRLCDLVVDIFSGCSGFGCKWVIWEFSFKSAVSSVSAVRCFGGCG